MNHQNLIGIIGRKGSGKDTAAEVLLSNGYTNVKFAGALKEMLRTLLRHQGVAETRIERMIEGDLKESSTIYLNNRTPRYAMQTLGTEWGRDLMGPNFHVDIALEHASHYKNVVITDIRFPNELLAIKDKGGICFGITADWVNGEDDEHESEALMDEMINALPDNQKITNYRAIEGHEKQAIQQFKTRFLSKVKSLGL